MAPLEGRDRREYDRELGALKQGNKDILLALQSCQSNREKFTAEKFKQLEGRIDAVCLDVKTMQDLVDDITEAPIKFVAWVVAAVILAVLAGAGMTLWLWIKHALRALSA